MLINLLLFLLIYLNKRKLEKNPQFVVNSYDRNDKDQDKIGNCWFISAVSGLVENKSLLHQEYLNINSFLKRLVLEYLNFGCTATGLML